jgi:hypothetical protein
MNIVAKTNDLRAMSDARQTPCIWHLVSRTYGNAGGTF